MLGEWFPDPTCGLKCGTDQQFILIAITQNMESHRHCQATFLDNEGFFQLLMQEEHLRKRYHLTLTANERGRKHGNGERQLQ